MIANRWLWQCSELRLGGGFFIVRSGDSTESNLMEKSRQDMIADIPAAMECLCEADAGSEVFVRAVLACMRSCRSFRVP